MIGIRRKLQKKQKKRRRQFSTPLRSSARGQVAPNWAATYRGDILAETTANNFLRATPEPLHYVTEERAPASLSRPKNARIQVGFGPHCSPGGCFRPGPFRPWYRGALLSRPNTALSRSSPPKVSVWEDTPAGVWVANGAGGPPLSKRRGPRACP